MFTAIMLSAITSFDRAEANRLLAQAEDAVVRSADVSQGQILIERAIAADPLYAAPHFNLAILLQAQEKWEPAEGAFKKFLELESTGIWADRARREIEFCKRYAEIDKDPEAKTARRFNEAVEMARRLLSYGRYSQALLVANSAAVINGRRHEPPAIAGAALMGLEKWPEAERMLLKAQLLAPEEAREAIRDARTLIEQHLPVTPELGVTVADLRELIRDLRGMADSGDSPQQAFLALRTAEPSDDTPKATVYPVSHELKINTAAPLSAFLWYNKSDDARTVVRSNVNASWNLPTVSSARAAYEAIIKTIQSELEEDSIIWPGVGGFYTGTTVFADGRAGSAYEAFWRPSGSRVGAPNSWRVSIETWMQGQRVVLTVNRLK